MIISWIYVFLAILLEVASAACLKFSEGFTQIVPSIFVFLFYAPCIAFISLALKKLNLSIVYAIWAGLGTVGITLMSILLLDEPASLAKVGAISLIIIGVIVLHLSKENEFIKEEEKDYSSSGTLVEKG